MVTRFKSESTGPEKLRESYKYHINNTNTPSDSGHAMVRENSSTEIKMPMSSANLQLIKTLNPTSLPFDSLYYFQQLIRKFEN